MEGGLATRLRGALPEPASRLGRQAGRCADMRGSGAAAALPEPPKRAGRGALAEAHGPRRTAQGARAAAHGPRRTSRSARPGRGGQVTAARSRRPGHGGQVTATGSRRPTRSATRPAARRRGQVIPAWSPVGPGALSARGWLGGWPKEPTSSTAELDTADADRGRPAPEGPGTDRGR